MSSSLLSMKESFPLILYGVCVLALGPWLRRRLNHTVKNHQKKEREGQSWLTQRYVEV